MNDIERIKNRLEKQFPSAEILLDSPDDPNLNWWLDIKINGKSISIEWRPKTGFGVSLNDENTGFGEGPDDVYEKISDTIDAVAKLINDN